MKSRKEPAAHLADYLNQEAQQIADAMERLARLAITQGTK